MSSVTEMFVSFGRITKKYKKNNIQNWDFKEINVSDDQALIIFCSKIKRFLKMLIWSNWGLFGKKNYATITISLTLWKIQNLGAPSSTSICNLTPYTWNCQHMHVHLVRTYKVFQCLRHYFINFILIVRHKSNMLMLGVIL